MKKLLIVFVLLIISNQAYAQLASGTISGMTNNPFTVQGSVGIGTSNPLANLQVNTGVDENFRVEPGSDGGGPSGAGISIRSLNTAANSQEPLTMQGNQILLNPGSGTGSIGIGTTVTSGSMTFGAAVSHAGQAACWATGGQTGYCTSIVGSSGGCTCVGF